MSVVYHVMMSVVVSSYRYCGKGGAGLNVSVPQYCDHYDYVQRFVEQLHSLKLLCYEESSGSITHGLPRDDPSQIHLVEMNVFPAS
jgi:hypothetical protein